MPEKNRNHRPKGAGQPPHHMTYIWWTHPKKTMARIKRMQQRVILSRSSRSADVNGAALNHAVGKTAISLAKKIILQTMPKTMKTPFSQPPNRTNGKMGESALINRP